MCCVGSGSSALPVVLVFLWPRLRRCSSHCLRTGCRERPTGERSLNAGTSDLKRDDENWNVLKKNSLAASAAVASRSIPVVFSTPMTSFPLKALVPDDCDTPPKGTEVEPEVRHGCRRRLVNCDAGDEDPTRWALDRSDASTLRASVAFLFRASSQ